MFVKKYVDLYEAHYKIELWVNLFRKLRRSGHGRSTHLQDATFLIRNFSVYELEYLIAEGEFFSGTNVLFIEMEWAQCHSNTARLVESFPEIQHFYGLALSENDKVWRIHSFGVDRKGRVVETTLPRKLYYGVVCEL